MFASKNGKFIQIKDCFLEIMDDMASAQAAPSMIYDL